MDKIKEILIDAMNNSQTEAQVVEAAGDNNIKTISDLLFKLACLMRKKDIEEEKSKTKSADALVKELKSTAKEKKNTAVAKALNKGMISWLTKHGSYKKRYAATSSEKCNGKGYGTGYKPGSFVKGMKAAGAAAAVVGSAIAAGVCAMDELNGGTSCTNNKGSPKEEPEKKEKQESDKKQDTTSNKLREEMPRYLLNAITKEKPAHPVYGKLRY